METRCSFAGERVLMVIEYLAPEIHSEKSAANIKREMA
jgi:hypothetical protein